MKFKETRHRLGLTLLVTAIISLFWIATLFMTGSTISSENLKRIFNKFYQADESRNSEGNGIGLAIVKKVVELHNVTVSVESKDGTATFKVNIPQ